MSIKTQGILVSVVMLIAAIWGADTVLPIVTIVLSLAGTIYAGLTAQAAAPYRQNPNLPSDDEPGTRSVNWTGPADLPLWRRIL